MSSGIGWLAFLLALLGWAFLMGWHAGFRAASVGRNAKRQDRADGLGPKDEHAVGEAETPKRPGQ